MVKEVKRKDLVIFGLIWALIFSVIGLYPLMNGENIRSWSISIAVVFIILSIAKPTIMVGFYRVWIKIGEFIGGIISKVIMFILYFGIFTPVALMLRLLGKDLLSKRLDKNSETYWITRETQPQSMKNQF